MSDVLPELPVLDLDPWEDVDMEDVEELVQELRHQPEFVQASCTAWESVGARSLGPRWSVAALDNQVLHLVAPSLLCFIGLADS